MSAVLMALVGDVVVNRDEPLEAFRDVRQILSIPDVLFGHMEGAYTDRAQPAPGAALVVGARAHNLDVFARVGFSVLSMAGNHVLDLGYETMLEARARLRSQGVLTCGAGESESEARAAAVVNANGLRIAFLAYASVFPMGYEALGTRPGLAPVRSHNFWREPFPSYYQPVHPLRLDSQEGRVAVDYLEKCNGSRGIRSTLLVSDPLLIGGFEAARVRAR